MKEYSICLFKMEDMMAKVRDRLREAEARILALRVAAGYPNLTASTRQIKAAVPDYIEFTPEDLKPSNTRGHENMWQQIMGNVVSHKASSTSIFIKGYAVRTEDGIQVTDIGMAYLKGKGF